MSIVTRHVFKKNGILLLCFLLVFFFVKLYSIGEIMHNSKENLYLTEWIAQMYDMDRKERADYINHLMTEVYARETGDGEEARQVSQLYSMNKNLEEICYLIDFAKNGEGIIPNVLPANYLELLEFYADMEYPRLIDSVLLDNYFNLQGYNIVPFITFLMFAIFFTNQYETQIYTYALTTQNGRLYSKRLKNVLLMLCFAFFMVNEVFDWVYSGLLFNSQLLDASVQSYHFFSDVQMHSGIGTVLLFCVFSKILGLFILCHLAELLAIKIKNIKDVMLCGMFFFLFCSLLTISFEGNKLLSCIQVGVVNWKDVIGNIEQCMSFKISYFVIGVGISCVIAVGSFLVLKREREKV